jgi:hypothetical protein
MNPTGKNKFILIFHTQKCDISSSYRNKTASLDLVQECLNLHQLQKRIELSSLENCFFYNNKALVASNIKY